jgi:hypothetical protein
MAITINTLTLSADMAQITLNMTTTATQFDRLYAYVNDDYLEEDPIDLSSLLTPSTQTENLVIDITSFGLEVTDTLKGIISFEIEDSANTEVETALVNLYYINLCLANMIVYQDAEEGFDIINTIYLLNEAITTYVSVSNPPKITEALNAYDRVLAMCEQNPAYLVTEDIDPCTNGSGCWIINGTYIVS